MSPEEKARYNALPLHEKAQYLLDKGITAKIQIDPERLAPAYVAFCGEVGLGVAGYHEGEEAAIAAATKWLEAKAVPPSLAGKDDPLYDDAVAVVRECGRGTIAGVQRKLRIGYNRAVRLVEAMEADGVLGPMDSLGRREVVHG